MVWRLLLLQLFGFVFLGLSFILDIIGNDPLASLPYNGALEFVAIGLLAGALVRSKKIIKEMYNNQLKEQKQQEDGFGLLARILDEHFDNWSLTPSERDVALMTVKGLMISEIAQLRKTRCGTVKAQCHSIYRKANVKGRVELLSLFIDELVARETIGNSA